MWEFTADVEIDCSRKTLWDLVMKVEDWWPKSNPDHVSCSLVSGEDELREGSKIHIRETVAGLPGEGVGEITRFEPPERIVWVSSEFVYRVLGVPLRVEEGVEWRISTLSLGVVLSAHVWARFPEHVWGRTMEFVSKRLLNGLQKDYHHAMKELHYLRDRLETGESA